MNIKKLFASLLSCAIVMSFSTIIASAETAMIDMQDAGYGINGGKSFTAEGITAYESTLGDLSEKYNYLNFTISADDLGGRDDLLFQVYISADNWTIWANAGETPSISAPATEYTFSLNLHEISDTYGSDKVICDMGFQILSATPGTVTVNYTYEFSNTAISIADNGTNEKNTESANNPETGIDVTAFPLLMSLVAATVTKKRA